ncbi:MAG: beta-lactamase family protein [Sandaracinaceae bacterium]|nr:beta-lactamase family protein [Sandaracinaceae bacterium]
MHRSARTVRRASAWGLALAAALVACESADPGDAGVAREDAALDAAIAAPDAGAPPEDFDGFVAWHMARGGIPGAAIAIVTPDAVVRAGGYGFADLETERRVDAHTLFVMASVSKPFAAVRALQLVEEGRLELDAPAGDALGYTLEHPSYAGRAVTTRMLLAHVAGVEDDFAALGEVTYTEDPPISLDEFTRRYALPDGALYAASHWGAAPGNARSYANAGFGIVGAILEAAGGEDLRVQSERAIFAPLALDGAGWFLADVDATRLATPYGFNGRRFSPLPQNGFAFYPASSLRISATGLARFAQMILRGGELDGARVLASEQVDELLRIQYPRVASGQALAFSRRRLAGRDFIGHSGATFGGSNQLLIATEGTHALLILTNADAYVRERIIPTLTEGSEAIDAILARMDEEARAP